MVKKSIIAIAVLAMLASVSFAQDQTGQVPGQIKVDGGWPKIIVCNWVPIEICRIPIFLKVGFFIEIKDCDKAKINMVQVNCLPNQTPPQSFPCYKGCTTIQVRSNFEAQLSLKLYKLSNIISSSSGKDNWKAYFRADAADTTQNATWIIAGDGNYHSVDICVEAWDADIFNGTPGQNPKVGEVAVLAIPTATCTCP